MHRALILLVALLLPPLLAQAQPPAPVGGDMSNTTVHAPGSSTARTLATRAGDVINVKDYGAIGDGASHPLTTGAPLLSTCPQFSAPVETDACGTQAAINYAQGLAAPALGGTQNTAPGYVLSFPAGTYLFDKTLIADNVTLSIHGAGISGATLMWTAPNGDGIHFGLNRHRALAVPPAVPAGGGGNGYTDGDLLRFGGTFPPTCITQPVVRASVAGGGVIQSYSIATPGDCSVIPALLQTPLTGGTGTGALAGVQSTQFTNPGGRLSIRDMMIDHAAGSLGGTFLTAQFGVLGDTSTYDLSHLQIGFSGVFQRAASLTSPSNSVMDDVRFAGDPVNSTVGFEMFAPPTGNGHFQLSFRDSYCVKWPSCFTFHIQGAPGFQGIMFTRNQGVTINDFVDIVADTGYPSVLPPQWVFTDNQTQQLGYFLKATVNGVGIGGLFAKGNLIYLGASQVAAASECGGFNMAHDSNSIIIGNQMTALTSQCPVANFIKSDGLAGIYGANEIANPNAWIASFTYANFQADSFNWKNIPGSDVLSANVVPLVNAGTNNFPTVVTLGGLLNTGGVSWATRTLTNGGMHVGAFDHYILVNQAINVAATIYLASPLTDGREIVVQDIKGNASSFPITLDGNGKNILAPNGTLASTYTLNTNWGEARVVYSQAAGFWSVVFAR